MGYFEDLKNSKDTAHVAFHKFAMATRERPNFLFCFFEGKDNVYYIPRIKKFTDEYFPLSCHGKQSVLKVYSLIATKEEYKKYKLGFFIDRDFNMPIKNIVPPIYVTPYYSIENFYVSLKVFKEILINEFYISEIGDENHDYLLNLYNSKQVEFHKAVILLNSWYSCVVEKCESERIPKKVKLTDKLPKDFIDFTLKEIKANYNYQTILDTFPHEIMIDISIVQKKINFFENKEYHKIFRGKYELAFLIWIIREIIRDSKKGRKFTNSEISFNFGDGSGLDQQKAMSIFTVYAETPQCLLDYIDRVINQNS